MKVIGVQGNYKVTTGAKPTVYFMADSSLLKDGKPFFVPTFAQHFVARPSLVVRISRLGKNISRKFAHRYYDAVTVGLTVVADGMTDKLENNLPGSLANAFDGAAILGDFCEAHHETDSSQMQFEVSANGQVFGGGSMTDLSVDIDGLIEYISQYCTLKIGDILFACNGWGEHQLMIDDKISGTLDGENLLSFRVK